MELLNARKLNLSWDWC